MRWLIALWLLSMPAGAAGLVCRPELACADTGCRATDPSNDEAADYVEDATGTNPQLYLGEGQWLAAVRTEGKGALTWTATAPHGQVLQLSVRTMGGAYLLVRTDTLGGRTFIRTGRCEDRP